MDCIGGRRAVRAIGEKLKTTPRFLAGWGDGVLVPKTRNLGGEAGWW